MSLQDGSGSGGDNLSFEAILDGAGFSPVGNNAEDFSGFKNLTDGHGDGLLRHIRQFVEPAFPYLLPTAGIIEVDDQIRFLSLEIGWRVVEGKMTIFPNANEGEVDGRGPEKVSNLPTGLGWVTFAVEQMIFLDARGKDESIE